MSDGPSFASQRSRASCLRPPIIPLPVTVSLNIFPVSVLIPRAYILPSSTCVLVYLLCTVLHCVSQTESTHTNTSMRRGEYRLNEDCSLHWSELPVILWASGGTPSNKKLTNPFPAITVTSQCPHDHASPSCFSPLSLCPFWLCPFSFIFCSFSLPH